MGRLLSAMGPIKTLQSEMGSGQVLSRTVRWTQWMLNCLSKDPLSISWLTFPSEEKKTINLSVCEKLLHLKHRAGSHPFETPASSFYIPDNSSSPCTKTFNGEVKPQKKAFKATKVRNELKLKNLPISYLIIVTDATDAVSVNFFGRCKFSQI